MSKILEKIVEPSKIIAGSTFLLKIKTERIQSCNLITETNDLLVTEKEEILITEGDFYE